MYLVKDKFVYILVCSFVIDSVYRKTLKFFNYCKMGQRPGMMLDQRRTAIGMLIGDAFNREGC